METFEDKLSRLTVIATAERQLPRDLGLWACALIRELANVRQAELSPSLTRTLRDGRILAAADLIGGSRDWASARILFEEGQRVERAWLRTRQLEVDPGTVAGELHAAKRWRPLPESCRSFFRLLTGQP